MTTKKATPPPLGLPERPPSKVEAGLAATEQTAAASTNDPLITADDKRNFAIEAMVAAGLSREFAEASFVLAGDGASPAEVAAAVGEEAAFELDFGAPLCTHGCHGQSWADVRADLDAVSCEHGSFSRRPLVEE